jgi:LPXTG-site transpeptidase (sortase) family protein
MHFGSKRFRKLFLIRTLSYFFIISGLLTLVLIIEPVINEELIYNYNLLTGRKYSLGPRVVRSVDLEPRPTQSPTGTNVAQRLLATPTPTPVVGGPTFGSLSGGNSNIIVPVSTDFGIVIEKINANAKVIANVDPASETAYSQALAQGVAHAKGTTFPGEKGNIYLFSHSTDAPWNIVRFNAIFYLLNKLEKGDQISLFYLGRRYDYIVFDKTIAKPDDTQYITNVYDDSVLTMQTCDPPGTLLNRLVVRAKLAGS